MDIFGILTMVGGLALFLYGMNTMGDGLVMLSGGKLEQVLEIFAPADAAVKFDEISPAPDLDPERMAGFDLAETFAGQFESSPERILVLPETLKIGIEKYNAR